MTYIPPERWRMMMVLYVLGGMLLGLANPALRAAMARIGRHPGIGTALDVNLFMPLLALTLAFLYPRLWMACAGALLATVAFHIGSQLGQNPAVWRWSFMGVVRAVHPILVAACIGYAAIGMVTSAVVRPWRDVGPPDTPLRCDVCGYLLVKLPQARCPECGTTFDPTRIARNSRESDYEHLPPQ